MQTATIIRSLLATTALLAPSAALADGRPQQLAALLDSVTVTAATRSETPIEKAPATVSVISSRQIEDELATDIKDMIRFEPGVSVRNGPSRFTAAGSSAGRDGNSGFNIRGLEGNRVLILVDGVRVPDAYSFGAQAMGRGDYVDVGVLKSLEILRGPASALYGSDGVVGAVSFVTKDPADYLRDGQAITAQGRISYNSADDSFARTAVVAGRQDAWSAFAAYTRRDGHEQENQGTNASPNANRTKPNPQDVFSNTLLAKLVFEPNDQHRLRLTLDHNDRKIDTVVLSALAPPPAPGQVPAPTSAIGLLASDSIRRNRISLDHLYRGEGLIETLRTSVYWQKSKTNEYSIEDRLTAADRTRIGSFDTRVKGAAIESASRFETDAATHRLVYGGDYSTTRQEAIRGGTVPPAGETFPSRAFPNTDYVLAGVFIQDEIGLLAGRLRIYPAVRLDHYKLDPQTNDPLFTGRAPEGQSKSHLSPKISGIFDLTPTVSVFANYGAGFKPPAPNQVNNGFANVVSNYVSISNPDLKPETSTTFEAGTRFSGERWRIEVTAFTGDFKDFISQQQVGGDFTPANPGRYQFVNFGKAKIKGIEARGHAHLGAGLTLNVAAAYAKGDTTSSGIKAPLDSVDPLKLVAGLGWRAPDGRLGGQVIVTHSARKSADRAGGACGANCYTPGAFTILDATAFVNVTDHATVRIGVFNITNENYAWWSDVRGQTRASTVLDAYTQPGRNVGISLNVRL